MPFFQASRPRPKSTLAPGATAAPEENKAAKFIGQTLGSDKLPVWKNVGPWENSKTPVTFDLFKGNVVMVEFFSVDCSHCQDAAPLMEALYQRYQPRGLKMVAVQSPIHPENLSGDETQWPKVQNFVNAADLTYPVGMDKDSKYFQQTIGGANYPTTMISNPTGKIVSCADWPRHGKSDNAGRRIRETVAR